MKSYGLLAEFRSADELIAATRRTRAAGFTRIEAYSPFPLEALTEAVGSYRDRMPLITLIGGIAGCLGGYFLQWYTATIDYPINSGGRPLHSWPSFIPITFEMTVLGAALWGVIGMLALNGLPKLYHPLFNVPEFELASRNRFFLCVRSDDPNYDIDRCRHLLQQFDPLLLKQVPA